MTGVVVNGKLESVKRYGLFRETKLIVQGVKLYDRTGVKDIVPKDIKKKIGKNVEIKYEETKTKSMDHLLDWIFGLGTRPPRTYNQILEMKVLE